jgi:hypothetical protein
VLAVIAEPNCAIFYEDETAPIAAENRGHARAAKVLLDYRVNPTTSTE